MAEQKDEADYDRIKYDPDTGQNYDEHIETVFHHVWNRNYTLEDKRAFPVLIDPYSMAYAKEKYISLCGALDSEAAAFKWAQQFGHVEIDYDIRSRRWSAFNLSADHFVTHADTAHALVLCGLQVLREHAYRVLGGPSGSKPN